MKTGDLASSLGLEAVCVPEADAQIIDGYTSDLLSDVMANAGEDSALVTIQAHRNTIAVASLAGIRAIVVCNGRDIPADMKDAAESEGIAIFRTGMTQFEVSGLLYTQLRA
jgi:uncharacterized protein YpuA (DUF1002 family)